MRKTNRSLINTRRAKVFRLLRRLVMIGLVSALLGTIAIVSVDYIVRSQGSAYILSPEDVPVVDAIIVLGALVKPDGQPSLMLHDRLETALELYQAGKAPKILVSGDHGRKNYNEVRAMKQYLLDRGVAEENIFMDHAGFNTYETAYRARDVFAVQSAVMVTQQYHLMRSVYNARKLGLEAYGVSADKQKYFKQGFYNVREVAARCKDYLLVNVLKPKPTFLGDVIPISGDGRATEG
ncbi:MAG: YdcF family protein [Gorillibacterium sp.]|nr:YdcF family protein [Gorillibacterium sp.]